MKLVDLSIEGIPDKPGLGKKFSEGHKFIRANNIKQN